MIKRPALRLIVTLCFFAFIASINAYVRPVQAQTCDPVTDEQIVADIYAKIKADSKLAPQISHINVVSVSAAVKLQGWADSKKDFDKIVEIVSDTKCVKLVNVNLFEETPPDAANSRRSAGGCAPGTKPCGDVCIPEGDACNITGKSGNDE